MILISVSPGEEVMESIARQLVKRGIADGAIVSLIGAIDSCRISNMPVDDAMDNIFTEYKEPFELSGTGEIVAGVLHIHCVLGTADENVSLAGHLHWARVESWFVNAYVMPLIASDS